MRAPDAALRPDTPYPVYVVGIATDGACVLLLRKERLDWLGTVFTGVGGRVPPGEAPAAAMDRTAARDLGTHAEDLGAWTHAATLLVEAASAIDHALPFSILGALHWSTSAAVAVRSTTCDNTHSRNRSTGGGRSRGSVILSSYFLTSVFVTRGPAVIRHACTTPVSLAGSQAR